MGGDSGELAAVGAVGGVAHPPGYPLFALWCRLWRWLPASSPTHRVALTTAITGALAIFMLERACRAWGARPLAAGLATGAFAFSPLAWRLASEPEVFMLNVLIALAIVIVAAPRRWSHETRRAIALAGLAGIGLSNHHSIILLMPLGLYAWGRAIYRSPGKWRTTAASIAAFAGGLLPYAYLVFGARSECAWGETGSLRGVLHHFLRVDYGTTQLAANNSTHEPIAQLLWLGHSFIESGIGLLLFAAGIAAIRRRRWSWELAMLTVALLVAGPLFTARFNLPPRGLMASVVIRFHLLPLALGTVLGALGLDALIDVIRSRLARHLVLGVTILVLLVRVLLSGADVVAHHRPTTERYLHNVLGFLPPNSIVLAAGDDIVGGFEYMQCVLAKRRDVVVIAPHLLLADWYGTRVDAKLGFSAVRGSVKPGDDEPTLEVIPLVNQLVASNRPVFITKWFTPNLERAFPSYPLGPLIRIVRTPANVPAPSALMRENEGVFAHFMLDASPPVASTWAAVRYADYGRTWNVLAPALEHEGDAVAAHQCRERARMFAPQGASYE